MIRIPITVKQPSQLTQLVEPISISIPFKSGSLFHCDELLLLDDQQQTIEKQFNILAYWSDRSIKWLSVSFLLNHKKCQESIFQLTDSPISKLNKQTEQQIQVTEHAQHFLIETKKSIFQLNKLNLGVFTYYSSETIKTVKDVYKSESDTLLLTTKQGEQLFPVIEKIHFSNDKGNNASTIKLTAYISGVFQSTKNKPLAHFNAEITIYNHSNLTQWRISLHNPKAMVHNNGTWDLGNENSLFFSHFNAIIPCKNKKEMAFCISDNLSDKKNKWQNNFKHVAIFQASSAGKNWNGKNHVDHQNAVNTAFKGYQLSTTIAEETHQQIVEGRATPSIYVQQGTDSPSISVHIENFWQKFPKAVEVTDNTIQLGLFPKQALGGFELQPGEKKTDTFYIAYGEPKNTLSFVETPTQATIAPEYLATTEAIPFFTQAKEEDVYNNIINEGINSNNNFFHKREVIDEFGWRNFGDLYADHETLEIENCNELISHYNNQYDPLYGFIRQYLLTQDTKWLSLANDLADHVKNIDIYHTVADKAEYNGGLFWHTDHYLPAETASHRTYSDRQVADAYQDHAGGGGPGGQHCYTTGLLLHYFLTGDESSKNAVLQLTDWITNLYEGSGRIGDFLLAIKNKDRIELKNITTGKYPLDRGTGHYVIALIDSFELTGRQSFLDSASLIIKHTIHPNDNITERNLNNIEECWFYTIFLQAVYRYLQVKEKLQQFDSSFQYARDALLQYATWMCKNEKPTLETPEKLEYPNHTWAAQDIRKANILFFAHYYAYDNTNKNNFHIKAKELYSYVISTLDKEPTRSFTRILSILMQNHGIKSFVEQDHNKKGFSYLHACKHEKILSNPKLVSVFFSTLSNTSILKELEWLKMRSSTVAHLLKKIGK